MPSTRDFKNRIRSVKNTQQITRAMKLVAASKVRRAQERIESARPYSQKMEELVNSLAQRVEGEPHPLLRDTMKSDKALLLVISSDKGLCGSYNTNVNRFALQFLRSREEEGKETELVSPKSPLQGEVQWKHWCDRLRVQGTTRGSVCL